MDGPRSHHPPPLKPTHRDLSPPRCTPPDSCPTSTTGDKTSGNGTHAADGDGTQPLWNPPFVPLNSRPAHRRTLTGLEITLADWAARTGGTGSPEARMQVESPCQPGPQSQGAHNRIGSIISSTIAPSKHHEVYSPIPRPSCDHLEQLDCGSSDGTGPRWRRSPVGSPMGSGSRGGRRGRMEGDPTPTSTNDRYVNDDDPPAGTGHLPPPPTAHTTASCVVLPAADAAIDPDRSGSAATAEPGVAPSTCSLWLRPSPSTALVWIYIALTASLWLGWVPQRRVALPGAWVPANATHSYFVRDPLHVHVCAHPDTIPDAALAAVVIVPPVATSAVAVATGYGVADFAAFWKTFGVALMTQNTFVELAKRYVGRPRPCFYDPKKCVVELYAAGAPQTLPPPVCSSEDLNKMRQSFPSGHASNSMASAVVVGLYTSAKARERWRGRLPAEKTCAWGTVSLTALWVSLAWWPLIILAGFVACSRVYDWWHHPSDVVAGACVGAVCSVWFYRVYFPQHNGDRRSSIESCYHDETVISP